ncbi:DUF732 domain-containing protein [Streptomyces xanthochromogenes]|uniref:DUF732 domain-containing protein n=1 Tax=Streptomyces xanthochromogenes TaxID=67384 RepID=UPI0038108AC5
MNHTRTAALVLAAAGLLLAGCSSNEDQNSPEARKKAAAEAVFAMQAAKGDPDDFQGVKPGVIAPEGHEVCDMLTKGQTVDDAATKIRLGFSDKAAGAIIGAAPALCPEHSPEINAWISGLHG